MSSFSPTRIWAVLFCIVLTSSLSAATLTWDADGTAGGATGGAGTWDTSSLLWNNAGTMIVWNNAGGHVALFGGTGGTVTLGEAITAAGLTFSADGYLLDGNGHTLTLNGTVSVTTAGQTAVLKGAITSASSITFNGAGNLTLDATSTLTGGGNLSKYGSGTLTLGGTMTDMGTLTFGGGVVTLSGSFTRSTYSSAAGLSVSSGTLNVTGTLGTASITTGQTEFKGNSVTNFSGTAFLSGSGSTFRVGEGTSATVNITAGSVTLGSSSAGFVLGRGATTAQGILNLSGGTLNVTSSTSVIRIGAGYSNTEVGGASVLTISGTGWMETGTGTGTILLGSNKSGNTQGTGTLNLDGGTLATLRTITGGSAAESTLNFNGGTLKANGTSMTLATSLTHVNVRDNGARIDTNGFNVSIARALEHSIIGGDAAIDGGLKKLGTGTLTFTGGDANTFTGVTQVLAGTLALSKTAGVNAIAGDVTIGDGSTAAILQLINSDQIADTSILTLNGTGGNEGIFRLNGRSETIGGLSSTSGAGFVENENASAGTLTLNNSGTQTFSGVLRNGTLAGTLSLVKSGAGTQILSGANTFTGTTTLQAGTLQFGINDALNATTSVILSASSGGTATLALNGYTWTAGALTFYDSSSTSSSQAVLDLGSGGLLTLSSSTFTLNNTNNPLGALITGGTLDLGASSRSFTIADSSNAAADMTIASDITATAVGNQALMKLGAGTLRLAGTVSVDGYLIAGAGVLEITGSTSNPASAYTQVLSSSATPVLRIQSGATLSTGILEIAGNTGYQGAVVMNGGQLNLTTSSGSYGIQFGYSSRTGTGYGAFVLNNGTVDTNRVDTGDGAAADSVSILRVTGGELNTANYIMFRNERWEFTVTGGQVLRSGDHIALGFRSTGSTTAQGVMTVAGGTVDNGARMITFAQQNDATANGTGHLNLNAGTLINGYINFYHGSGTTMNAFVNFNGGLYRAAQTATMMTTSGSGGTGSLTAYVNGAFGAFDGGLKIDTNGFTTTISNALLAPSGNGVATIPVTAGGSGYIAAPYVEISGGGGSGATAYATVDTDPSSPTYGHVTGIVVTNPGRDYTSAPTITFKGGGGSGATVGTVTLAANTSGGLTKSGAGTLVLSGADANTFTGMTTVTAGVMQLAKTAGVTAIAGDVTIGDGSTAAILKLTNSEQIADTSTVTLNGTGSNAGILRLNSPSETIASLSSTGGAGVVENESGVAGTRTLTLAATSGSATFSGILRDGDGVGTDGTLALVKTGAGTQVLTGANTYSGSTTISGGELQIGDAGSGQSGTGAVTVQSGGTLTGSGLVQGSSFTAQSGATVHAGDGTAQGDYGTLTFTPVTGSGSFDFQSGSNIVLGISSPSTHDLLAFDGASGSTLTFNGNLTVAADIGYTAVLGHVFNLLDWSSLVTTDFTNFVVGSNRDGSGDNSAQFDLPDISSTGFWWDVSQFTTNGNIIVVPEPSRAFLLLCGLVMLVGTRRRR